MDSKELVSFFSLIKSKERTNVFDNLLIINDSYKAIKLSGPRFYKFFYGLKYLDVDSIRKYFSQELAEYVGKVTILQRDDGEELQVFGCKFDDCFVFLAEEVFREAYVSTQVRDLILESIPKGIIAIDKESKIVLYNNAYSKLDELSKRRVLNKYLKDVYCLGDDGSTLKHVMDTKQPMLAYRQEYSTIDKKICDVVKDTYPLVDNGEIIGAFSFVNEFEYASSWSKRILLQNNSDSINEGKPDRKFKTKDTKVLRVYKLAKEIPSNQNVCVYGEMGTQKDLLIDTLTKKTKQLKNQVYTIDLEECPLEIVEKLLFGFEIIKNEKKVIEHGVLDEAKNGTLILYNIHVLPMKIQKKLYMFMKYQTYYRMGASKKTMSNVRIIYSTIVNPITMVEENKLLPKLIYQGFSYILHIPPLRERLGDIIEICNYCLKKSNEKNSIKVKGFDESFIRAIQKYNWPGNDDELNHVLDSVFPIVLSGTYIQAEFLPQYILERIEFEDENTKGGINMEQSLKSALCETEQLMIKHALQLSGGNISKAAELLGIKRQNLQYRIKKVNGSREA
ncbi:arginine utilization transcriptional regulator RocR [Gottschalkiaceae bacterium SANA]|nr:arginine utilization transcriptional regulator RocR [Gottschalkiaceae bacterium SANA]